MSAPAVNLWLGIGLAAIVIIASALQLRAPTAHRGRRMARLGLQAIVAALLYFCLLPPSQQRPAGGVVVLTADAAAAG
ncbi:hypothetical protein ACQKDV_15420, partial [Stenotrophomonas sp. NPDC077659]